MELKVITEKKALLPTSQGRLHRAAQPLSPDSYCPVPEFYASKPSAQCLEHFTSSKIVLPAVILKTSASPAQDFPPAP